MVSKSSQKALLTRHFPSSFISSFIKYSCLSQPRHKNLRVLILPVLCKNLSESGLSMVESLSRGKYLKRLYCWVAGLHISRNLLCPLCLPMARENKVFKQELLTLSIKTHHILLHNLEVACKEILLNPTLTSFMIDMSRVRPCQQDGEKIVPILYFIFSCLVLVGWLGGPMSWMVTLAVAIGAGIHAATIIL